MNLCVFYTVKLGPKILVKFIFFLKQDPTKCSEPARGSRATRELARHEFELKF
jgi:hypothetical protein